MSGSAGQAQPEQSSCPEPEGLQEARLPGGGSHSGLMDLEASRLGPELLTMEGPEEAIRGEEPALLPAALGSWIEARRAGLRPTVGGGPLRVSSGRAEGRKGAEDRGHALSGRSPGLPATHLGELVALPAGEPEARSALRLFTLTSGLFKGREPSLSSLRHKGQGHGSRGHEEQQPPPQGQQQQEEGEQQEGEQQQLTRWAA